jgi:translation initiation factor 3 subunit C
LTVTISRATTGFDKIPLPKFYIKTMAELDDFLNESLSKEKSGKKKGGNTKAMNNLKQKLKKLSKQYDELIAAYRKVDYSKKRQMTSFFLVDMRLIKLFFLFRILRSS